jgi:hypothetical protein
MGEQAKRINPDAVAGLFSKRVIGPQELADFFGLSKYWVYRQLRGDAPDKPPRCAVAQLRFDTWNVEFQAWLNRKLGLTESDQTENVSSSVDGEP